jgi:hypothetical protein
MKGRNALVMLLNVPTGEKVTVWIAARRLYGPKRLVRITLAKLRPEFGVGIGKVAGSATGSDVDVSKQ